MIRKPDIVARFRERTPFTKRESELILDTLLDTIADGLRQGQDVDIRGFGRFVPYTPSPRSNFPKARDAEPKVRVKFRPGMIMLKLLNPGRKIVTNR